MSPKSKHYRIALSGGGTGGHVYPALAILQRLRQLIAFEQPDALLQVLWLGSKRGIEREILAQQSNEPGLHLEYCGISCGKLRRYFSWQNGSDLFRIALGIYQSYRILGRKRPCLLFSKGGFVAVPGVVAAKMLGIPTLAHESDLDPGLATRLTLPLVQTLFLPYQQSRKYYKAKYQGKLVVSGNPVRAEFFSHFYQQNAKELAGPIIPAHWFNAAGQLRQPLLLVLGGSLGAREINSYVQQWLQGTALKQFYILHQCGPNQYAELKDRGTQNYQVLPFISQGLGAVYQLCRQSGGLVISRAGAGSLWEILASGNRAVIVPLQSGSRGDQLRNAQFFAQQGWAHCFIPEANQRNSQKLLEQILLILQDSQSHCREYVADAALYIAQKVWKQAQQSV